jgi:hypothetical protein
MFASNPEQDLQLRFLVRTAQVAAEANSRSLLVAKVVAKELPIMIRLLQRTDSQGEAKLLGAPSVLSEFLERINSSIAQGESTMEMFESYVAEWQKMLPPLDG